MCKANDWNGKYDDFVQVSRTICVIIFKSNVFKHQTCKQNVLVVVRKGDQMSEQTFYEELFKIKIRLSWAGILLQAFMEKPFRSVCTVFWLSHRNEHILFIRHLKPFHNRKIFYSPATAICPAVSITHMCIYSELKACNALHKNVSIQWNPWYVVAPSIRLWFLYAIKQNVIFFLFVSIGCVERCLIALTLQYADVNLSHFLTATLLWRKLCDVFFFKFECFVVHIIVIHLKFSWPKQKQTKCTHFIIFMSDDIVLVVCAVADEFPLWSADTKNTRW